MAGLSIQASEFTYQDLVSGLREGRFKKILVISGAGISVSAGIPDFRSPGSGVYDNLQEYDLPTKESIFEINFFKEKPEVWYKFAKTFNLSGFKPTPTHFFLKMLQDKGLLAKVITQNIDNLEEKAGMDMSGVLQCHGADKNAECSFCRASHSKEVLE